LDYNCLNYSYLSVILAITAALNQIVINIVMLSLFRLPFFLFRFNLVRTYLTLHFPGMSKNLATATKWVNIHKISVVVEIFIGHNGNELKQNSHPICGGYNVPIELKLSYGNVNGLQY